MTETIWKEFKGLKIQQVWRNRQRHHRPDNNQCIKNKWMFGVNCDKVYHDKHIACGYIQVPSMNFSEKYLPYRWQWNSLLLCGFLRRDLLEIPKGIECKQRDDCVILDKCIQCLVQGTRQYYEMAVEFKNSTFSRGKIVHAWYSVHFSSYRCNIILGNPEIINEALRAWAHVENYGCDVTLLILQS